MSGRHDRRARHLRGSGPGGRSAAASLIREVALHEHWAGADGVWTLFRAIEQGVAKNVRLTQCGRHLVAVFGVDSQCLVTVDLAGTSGVFSLAQEHIEAFITHQTPIPSQVGAMGLVFEAPIVLADFWREHLVVVTLDGRVYNVAWSHEKEAWAKSESTAPDTNIGPVSQHPEPVVSLFKGAQTQPLGVGGVWTPTIGESFVRECALAGDWLVWVQATEGEGKVKLAVKQLLVHSPQALVGDADGLRATLKRDGSASSSTEGASWRVNFSKHSEGDLPHRKLCFGGTSVVVTNIPANAALSITSCTTDADTLFVFQLIVPRMPKSQWLMVWSARERRVEVFIPDVGFADVKPMVSVDLMRGDVIPCFDFPTIMHTAALLMASERGTDMGSQVPRIVCLTSCSTAISATATTTNSDVVYADTARTASASRHGTRGQGETRASVPLEDPHVDSGAHGNSGIALLTSALDVIVLERTPSVLINTTGSGLLREAERYQVAPFVQERERERTGREELRAPKRVESDQEGEKTVPGVSDNTANANDDDDDDDGDDDEISLVIWPRLIGVKTGRELCVYSKKSQDIVQRITHPTRHSMVRIANMARGSMRSWLSEQRGVYLLAPTHYTTQISAVTKASGSDVGSAFAALLGKEVLSAQLLYAKIAAQAIEKIECDGHDADTSDNSDEAKMELFSILLRQLQSPGFLVAALGSQPTFLPLIQAALERHFAACSDGVNVMAPLEAKAESLFSLGPYAQDVRHKLEQYADAVGALFASMTQQQQQCSSTTPCADEKEVLVSGSTPLGIAELLKDAEGIRGVMAADDHTRSQLEAVAETHPKKALEEIFRYFNIHVKREDCLQLSRIRTEVSHTLLPENVDGSFASTPTPGVVVAVKRQLQHALFEMTCRLLYNERPRQLFPFIRCVTEVLVVEVHQAESPTHKDFAHMCKRALACLPPVPVLMRPPSAAVQESIRCRVDILLLLSYSSLACDVFLRQCMWDDALRLFAKTRSFQLSHLFASLIQRMHACGVLRVRLSDVFKHLPASFTQLDILRLFHAALPTNTEEPFGGGDDTPSLGELRACLRAHEQRRRSASTARQPAPESGSSHTGDRVRTPQQQQEKDVQQATTPTLERMSSWDIVTSDEFRS